MTATLYYVGAGTTHKQRDLPDGWVLNLQNFQLLICHGRPSQQLPSYCSQLF